MTSQRKLFPGDIVSYRGSMLEFHGERVTVIATPDNGGTDFAINSGWNGEDDRAYVVELDNGDRMYNVHRNSLITHYVTSQAMTVTFTTDAYGMGALAFLMASYIDSANYDGRSESAPFIHEVRSMLEAYKRWVNS